MGKNSLAKLDPAAEFSLVLGGPLFQLFRKAHLTGDALELVRQRIIAQTGRVRFLEPTETGPPRPRRVRSQGRALRGLTLAKKAE